jgi:hypothetical protein
MTVPQNVAFHKAFGVGESVVLCLQQALHGSHILSRLHYSTEKQEKQCFLQEKVFIFLL